MIVREPANPPAPAPGITLIGHPFAHIGRGEDVRQTRRALQAAGVRATIRDVFNVLEPEPDIARELRPWLVQDFNREVNIFHINGDEVEPVLRHLGGNLPGDAYNIVYPMWELSRYPEVWAAQLNRFDEIWTASRFTCDAISPLVTRPVLHLPLPGEVRFRSFIGRRHFRIPEGAFTFLFFFDFTSYIARKNPFAVLEAFERLCRMHPDADMCLVIKCKGGESRAEDHQRFRDCVAQLKGRVFVIDQVLSDNEIKNLIRCCDCFVSLHRSEGFGLGPITAMFLGKPVIATGYSATTDYMDESNACLVRYSLAPVPDGAYPHSDGQVWAEPDVDDAADHMSRLMSNPSQARALGAAASRHIRVHFSLRAAGLRYHDRLSEIAGLRSPAGARGQARMVEARRMLAMFEEELARIDRALADTRSLETPELFRRLPLEDFASLVLAVPERFPNLKRWLPAMPPDQVQDSWTGTHGEDLLGQSLAFIRTMLQGYPEISGRSIRDAIVLDYGCGWGRLIRLLYKVVPVEHIYGVDPWDQSIALCREYGVRGNLAISDWVPERLPFNQTFDLIFAFSVFTHLSAKTTRIVMSTLRRYIQPHGVLLITIRPAEYWHHHEGGALLEPMSRAHESTGFAFSPHNRPPINGDITYGDTSITPAYIEKNFPQWRIHSLEYNRVDPLQVLVFLTPA